MAANNSNNAISAASFDGLDSFDDNLQATVSALLDEDTTTASAPPPSSAAGPNHPTNNSPSSNNLPFRNASVSPPGAAAIATPTDTQSYFGPESSSPNWTYQDTPLYNPFSRNPFDAAAAPYPQSWALQGHAAAAANIVHQQHLQQARAGHFSSADISPTSLYAATGPSRITLRPGLSEEGIIRPNPPPEILSTLTPAQQEKLKSIAMPAHLQYHSPKSEPGLSPGSSASGNEKAHGSSPEVVELSSKTGNRKRKTSADVDDEEDDEEADDQQPVKKTAHNMIEKRYRTNLNDKIAALRDSVPALRIMSKSARGEDTTEDREELHGLTPAHKLNKATVLSKATEYIRHLEKRNNRLLEENNSMQARIAAFEKLFMGGAMNGQLPNPLQQTPPLQYPQDAQAYMNTPVPTPQGQDPAGMIPVSDDMRKILASQAAIGRPYPVPPQPFQTSPTVVRQQQIQQQQQAQAGRWANGGPYLGKLMVGALAGLMIVESVRETEQSNENPEGRGLSMIAIPLRAAVRHIKPTHINIAGYQTSTDDFLSTLKMLILLGALLWVFVPSLFAPRPPKHQKPPLNRSLQALPSLASPIHVRRQAWLTAIQTVWVPNHNFFLEAVALVLKTMKFTLRNTISMKGYQMLTGLTEEQETARVKAWTIALDAQLAGGDVEINKSRLTLTLLASGTLPDTPLRLMLKALHIRVLLWQVELGPAVFNMIAAKLARAKWNEAKQLNRLLAQLSKGPDAAADEEVLPEHLAVLLEQDCHDVLNDDIVQRAHNLAWNHPTTHNVVEMIDGMNAAVDDPAVRSPMDAVCAWYSNITLQRVLGASLEGRGQAACESDLDLAIKVAPIGSNAQVRALVARTFVVDEKRGANIAIAMEAMGPTMDPDKYPQYSNGIPPLVDSPMSPIFPDRDIQMALRCSQGIAHLQKHSSPPQWALSIINSIFLPRRSEGGMSLLGFTAAFILMNTLRSHSVGGEACAVALERLAASLRIWVGGTEGDCCGLDPDVRRILVDRCLTVTKSVVGIQADPGYGSMSECDDDGRTC